MPICHHYHRIHRRLRGVRLASPARFPVGTLSPAQILTAYGFKQNQYAGARPVKIGIGSLGGGVVQADVANIVKAWGMSAPKITVRTVGGAVNEPVDDQDSNVENMLDLEIVAFTWWWLTGTAADITMCFGPNARDGMTEVTNDLVAAGVEVASWSWGSAAIDWDPAERKALAAAFAAAVAKGVTFCAASGDNSIDDGTTAPTADYPSSDPNVWGVGGTRLTIASATGLRASESAWGDGRAGDEGGGGGFDPTVAIPPFQQGIVTGRMRGVPDTSANADPVSGWQISANGAFTVVGGTSAASPFTAALIAVAKAMGAMKLGLVTPEIYAAHLTACNDVVLGSNGAPSGTGWDPATGLGSPNGAGFIAALAGVVPQPPKPPPPPVPQPTTVEKYDAIGWAAKGLVENWPSDGTLPSLSDAQKWASNSLAKKWPTP
jgi:kumamolisin